ncbi:uncharacterized protein F5147DRAFT_671601 [Suillus discolor]|uniref:Uncharacterized protein n=1 Tax=Suillus discolor TaxID=1912936 RepID=A0A9P7FGP8_9AGAM|nr:uncharacterized protein F5147DRAFT_671601 [Suillus discolor]KAG2117178.1 hypothetical protein F5147DRAFT_671601 [Suillus discolor]
MKKALLVLPETFLFLLQGRYQEVDIVVNLLSGISDIQLIAFSSGPDSRQPLDSDHTPQLPALFHSSLAYALRNFSASIEYRRRAVHSIRQRTVPRNIQPPKPNKLTCPVGLTR